MKKFTKVLFLLFFLFTNYLSAQNSREIIINSTGYGFSTHPSSPNGVAQWDYIQKFANITHNGQNASVTGVRLYVDWTEYEPTDGNYQRAKFRQAVEAILSLNNNTMKIAFHFPYQLSRHFVEDPNTFVSTADMAQTHQGVNAGDHYYRPPSLYNDRVRNKYYAFVDDALSQISDYYHRILYVQAGNGNAEEFGQPYAEDVNQSGMYNVALHDSWAVNAWRTEYLPCRYPGQSTVTWGGQTFNISNAPLGGQYGSHYSNWNDEHGREFHRFGSWGIQRFYQGLRNVVKSKSSNIKVLYFGSDFGGMQGNLIHFHSAQLPMSMAELDGLSITAGSDVHTNRDKILPIDVMKATNPNKIAAIEFDPTDLGQDFTPQNILPGVAEEWFARAYKHGADYIHLAMHFHDPAIETLKPALAMIRANYIDVPYTPPARQTPVNVNVVPNVFTGTHLFWDTWKNTLNGDNWSVTDNNPVSIRMIDDGYWENIWSCSPVNPCDFNISASGPSGNVNTNASVTLNATCSGSSCSGVTYTWSGNGISGSGTSVSFNAPNSAGSYTYTVTASKSGCSNKTATVTVNVVNPGDPCAFTVSASGPSGNVAANSSVTLNSSCSGECTGVTYAWSGNGISGSGTSITFNAPNSAGSYTYTVTASKSGCSNKTATVTITVPGSGGSICDNYTFTDGQLLGTAVGASVYVRVINSCLYVTTHHQSFSPVALDWLYILVDNNGWASGVTPFPRSVVDSCFKQPDQTCSTPNPCSFTVSASGPSGNVNTNASVTLNSSCSGECSGVTYSWSGNGISGSGTSVSFNAPNTAGSYTYTITASKSGCSNQTATVTVNVVNPTNPCAFTLSASGPTGNVTTNSSVTLNSSCSGECSGVSYAWSGNGISGSGTSVSFNAPNSAGSYTYTITGSKSGCSNQTATATINVVTGGGTVNCSTSGGHFDGANCTTISGWAWDGSQPNTPVVVEIYNGNTLIQGNILANNFRQDLLDAYIGNGVHGFSIPLPAALKDGGSHWISVRIAGCSTNLNNSPKNISGCTGSSAVIAPYGEDAASAAKALNVFPNPSNGTFETSFYLERGQKANIVLTDLQGRTLLNKAIVGNGTHVERINVGNKAAGTLFLRLVTNNGTEVKKISVIR